MTKEKIFGIEVKYIGLAVLVIAALFFFKVGSFSLIPISSQGTLNVDFYCSCSSFGMPIIVGANTLGNITGIIDKPVPATVTTFFCLGATNPGQSCTYTQTYSCQATFGNVSAALTQLPLYVSPYANSGTNYQPNGNIAPSAYLYQGATGQNPYSAYMIGSQCQFLPAGGFNQPIPGATNYPNPPAAGFGYMNITVSAQGYKTTTELIHLNINEGGYYQQPILVPILSSSAGTTTPPGPGLPSILQSLQNYFAVFVAQLQQIQNWISYFGNSLHLFSITATNQTNNVTTLGSTVVGNINLQIPSNLTSTKWTPSVTYLTRTYCQAGARYNNSGSFIYNTSLTNMTTASFTATIPIKTAQTGILIFGGACQTTNNQFNFTKGAWGGWKPYANVTVQKFAVYVAGPQQLTTSSGAGGIVKPNTQSYSYGTMVSIAAQSNAGYSFTGWKGTGIGNYTGTNANATVTMYSGITETASFQVSTTLPPPPPQPNILQQLINYLTSLFNQLFPNGL